MGRKEKAGWISRAGDCPPNAASLPRWAGEPVSLLRPPPERRLPRPERRARGVSAPAAPLPRAGERCAPQLPSSAARRHRRPRRSPLLSAPRLFLSPFIFFHDFLSRCQLELLANPALPHPAVCPPCTASSPVILGCELKGCRERKRKGKKCREWEGVRKYFVSCGRCSFTNRPSLSSLSLRA